MPFLAEEVTKLFRQLLKMDKGKDKKIRSDRILNSESLFKAEVMALARLELL